MAPYKIVMVRHGESEWNEKNLFCGWFDANLSQKGRKYNYSAVCPCMTFSPNLINIDFVKYFFS